MDMTFEEREVLEVATGLWWLFLITGIGWLVFALLVFQWDYTTVYAISYLFGFFVFSAGRRTSSSGWGSPSLAGRSCTPSSACSSSPSGSGSLVDPHNAFATLAGAGLPSSCSVKGIFDITVSFFTKGFFDLWWLQLVPRDPRVGAGLLGLGEVPAESAILLVVYVGIVALTRGIIELFVAFKLRSIKQELRRPDGLFGRRELGREQHPGPEARGRPRSRSSRRVAEAAGAFISTRATREVPVSNTPQATIGSSLLCEVERVPAAREGRERVDAHPKSAVAVCVQAPDADDGARRGGGADSVHRPRERQPRVAVPAPCQKTAAPPRGSGEAGKPDRPERPRARDEGFVLRRPCRRSDTTGGASAARSSSWIPEARRAPRPTLGPDDLVEVGAVHWSSSFSASARRFSPARVLVLTVPSGSSSFWAISLWESPPQ